MTQFPPATHEGPTTPGKTTTAVKCPSSSLSPRGNGTKKDDWSLVAHGIWGFLTSTGAILAIWITAPSGGDQEPLWSALTTHHSNVSSSSPWYMALVSLQVLYRIFGASVWGLDPPHQIEEAVTSVACPILDPDDPSLANFHLAVGSSHNNPCDSLDWYILVYMTLIIFAINWVTRVWILQPLVNGIAHRKNHPTWNSHLASKTTMNVASALTFLLSGILAWCIIGPMPWLTQPRQWFEHAGQEDETHRITPDLKLFYLFYAARFMVDIISLHFEQGRSWSTLMVSWMHHTITVALVLGSAAYDLHRVGSVIMFFFDWADPGAFFAKACLYLKDERQGARDPFQQGANVNFVIFAVLYFITRIGMYGVVIWYALTFPPLPEQRSAVMVLRSLLLLLAGLQIYWGAMIIKVFQGIGKDGRAADPREK